MPKINKSRSIDGLSPKQAIFCNEYLTNGFNATQAALKAGYSKKTAYASGIEALKKPQILAYINARINSVLEGQRERLKAEIIEAARKIALSDIGDIVKYDQDGVAVFPSETVDTSIIQSVEIKQELVKAGQEITVSNKYIKFKLHSKTEAMKILSQYIGLAEPVNVNVDLTGLEDYTQKILDKINASKQTDNN